MAKHKDETPALDVPTLTKIDGRTLDLYGRVAGYHGKRLDQWLLDAVQAHAWRSIKAIPAESQEDVLKGESVPVLYSVE